MVTKISQGVEIIPLEEQPPLAEVEDSILGAIASTSQLIETFNPTINTLLIPWNDSRRWRFLQNIKK